MRVERAKEKVEVELVSQSCHSERVRGTPQAGGNPRRNLGSRCALLSLSLLRGTHTQKKGENGGRLRTGWRLQRVFLSRSLESPRAGGGKNQRRALILVLSFRSSPLALLTLFFLIPAVNGSAAAARAAAPAYSAAPLAQQASPAAATAAVTGRAAGTTLAEVMMAAVVVAQASNSSPEHPRIALVVEVRGVVVREPRSALTAI